MAYDADGDQPYSTAYDEYEGIFGPLGVARNRSELMPRRSSGSRSRRRFSRREDSLPSYGNSRSSGFSRVGSSGISGSGYAMREKYLSDRQRKRRVASFGGMDQEDDDRNRNGTAADGTGKSAQSTLQSAMQSQQIWLPAKNFTFRQRAGRLDTRMIARLDLEKIVATTDIAAIQRHLENLAFSDVTLEDVEQYSDAYFLKLFQIAQLTLEYLLNVQDSLVSHCDNLETQCVGLADETMALERENEAHERDILSLKKEIRHKQNTLATFEVMLVNASAAKRVQAQNAAVVPKVDQENDPAVLNILGETPITQQEEGALAAPVTCVLCNKKFVSAEYLVRHQQKMHRDDTKGENGGEREVNSKYKRFGRHNQRRNDSDAFSSDSRSSNDSKSESSRRKKTRTKPKLPPPLPAEVVQALQDRNELTKQLIALQEELRHEKERRANETKQAELQQTQLVSQVASHMNKFQEMLNEIEQKQEQAKHEMIRYTQQALEKLNAEREKTKAGEQSSSRLGQLESDDDDNPRKPKAHEAVQVRPTAMPYNTGSGDKLEKMLDAFLRAQAEKQQEIDELEYENKKLQSKHSRMRRRQRQLAPLPQTQTALMAMAALDAKRFEVDPGIIIAGGKEVISQTACQSPSNFNVVREEKIIQTEEERVASPTEPAPLMRRDISCEHGDEEKKCIVSSRAVDEVEPPMQDVKQTPSHVTPENSKLRKPRVTASKAILPPPVKKEPPILTPETEAEPKAENKRLHSPLDNKTDVKDAKPIANSISQEVDEETKRQHAATIIGKVARGVLVRQVFKNPVNWKIVVPCYSLERALTDPELFQLTRLHNGQLRDIEVDVVESMTANELRVAVAEALNSTSRFQEEANDCDRKQHTVPIEYHRIILHDKRTGNELHGNQIIHHLLHAVEIEIIPSFEAAELHVETVFDFHEAMSTRLQDIRRSSMELSLNELNHSLPLSTPDEHNGTQSAKNVSLIRGIIRIQAMVRRFLATRTAKMLQIDQLVEARLASFSPRVAATQSHRQSVDHVSRISSECSELVRIRSERIHQQLADIVKQKIGIVGAISPCAGATNSAMRTEGLSATEYEHHISDLQSERKKLPMRVQELITNICEQVESLAKEEYDPERALTEEGQFHAAARVQHAIQKSLSHTRALMKPTALNRNEAQSVTREDAVEIDSNSTPQSMPLPEAQLNVQHDTTGDSGDTQLEEYIEKVSNVEEENERKDGEEITNILAIDDEDDEEVKRLADAYEKCEEDTLTSVASFEAEITPTQTGLANHATKLISSTTRVTRSMRSTILDIPARAGTPAPGREDQLGRSPRPTAGAPVISPFSSTPLLARRSSAARRGSGHENAR